MVTGESCESNESQQFMPSVEEQAKTDRQTNRWHKQGARTKGSRYIRLSRVSRIAAVASSTPDTAMTRLVNTGILQPPIHLENRFEALMNVDEESQNVTKLGSNQPAANIATNRCSRSSRQWHSAQSAAEPRTLIVGDSIIRNISSSTTTTCCFPQATVSDVNKELRNIVMKHKTAIRVIIHVGKNDIRKGQSELLKQDFSELFETLQRLEVQSLISGPLPARGTNMFSRLLGLNTWLQRTCSTKGVNFIDNFNIFWGHRQLFKLDGLHPNKLGARVLKDNFYFSLVIPQWCVPIHSHTHLDRIWVTTGLHISFRVIMWLKNPTRTLITPRSQNKHCSWTSRLSPAHRAHHMQTVTYNNSSKTQHPRTTFWKTAWEARTTHHSHQKHQS